ncbi:hypothetical protein C8046_12525 [Serinibacter arcticus]|uniref:HTH marR-type domain-containing protein n=1 Tax=Serinibacter arcticus TaxID=1655435 RepID=A0A2U1ZWM0_9MICO|nr:hypothetical protein C8046_12525 [Serinibacter arcticus]
MRRHNLQLVLRALDAAPGSSRAELATAVGLTPGALTPLVAHLLERGLVRPTAAAGDDAGPRGRGRPGVGLEVDGTGVATLAVVVGDGGWTSRPRIWAAAGS